MTNERVPLIPGAETPEGQRRITKATRERDEVDFRAFMLLKSLDEEGLLSENAIFRTLKGLGESDGFARETAQDLAEQVSTVLKDRLVANDEVLNALAGRPS